VELGLFGGSFDPPHVGHLVVAQDALERLGLDGVRFVPARRSPFKSEGDAGADPALRLALVRAAVAGHPVFTAEGLELERASPSYTIDTVRILRDREPGVRWTLLLGSDQWASFDRWREAGELARLARIAVLARAGDTGSGSAGPDLPHVTVPVTRVDISSTDIRRRVREGRSIRYLVPEPVRALIEANGLYTTC
jgi:nicotinate-nucleotide adenylyltransferase